MGDEVAQRDIIHAESISGDEIREPRRRNSRRIRRPEKLKITCQQGMQVSGRGVQPTCKGRRRAERQRPQGT